MATYKNFIVNGVVGTIVVSFAVILLAKLFLRSMHEKDFWGYSRLLFIIMNMILVWVAQVLLFVLQEYNFFFLYFAPLLQLISTFCFAHWYFDSTRKTVGLKLSSCSTQLLRASLYLVPILLVFGYALNVAIPYSIPIFQFGEALQGLTGVLAFYFLAKMIYEVRQFCKCITQDRRVLSNDGITVENGAELNLYIALVHCVFVLLSGLFVIIEAKSLFSIALLIHPEDNQPLPVPYQINLLDSFSCVILAVLDLFVCYMLKKIIFDVDEGQQILLDKVSGKAYYIIKNIPYGERLLTPSKTDSGSSSQIADTHAFISETSLILDVDEMPALDFRAHSMDCSVIEQFLQVSMHESVTTSTSKSSRRFVQIDVAEQGSSQRFSIANTLEGSKMRSSSLNQQS